MKQFCFVIALISLTSSGLALGQISGEQNNIGVYFDAAGTQISNNDGLPGLKHVYVVISGLTRPSVDGFEFKITASGGLLISYDSVAFPVNTIDVGTRFGEIIAGFDHPLLAREGRVLVMEFDIMVTDMAMPGSLFIHPVNYPSLAGAPAYLSGGQIVTALPSAAPGQPVLVTNSSEGPLAAKATSWNKLKNLIL